MNSRIFIVILFIGVIYPVFMQGRQPEKSGIEYKLGADSLINAWSSRIPEINDFRPLIDSVWNYVSLENVEYKKYQDTEEFRFKDLQNPNSYLQIAELHNILFIEFEMRGIALSFYKNHVRAWLSFDWQKSVHPNFRFNERTMDRSICEGVIGAGYLMDFTRNRSKHHHFRRKGVVHEFESFRNISKNESVVYEYDTIANQHRIYKIDIFSKEFTPKEYNAVQLRIVSKSKSLDHFIMNNGLSLGMTRQELISRIGLYNLSVTDEEGEELIIVESYITPKSFNNFILRDFTYVKESYVLKKGVLIQMTSEWGYSIPKEERTKRYKKKHRNNIIDIF